MMEMNQPNSVYILVLARPTPGDDRYYERWQEVGHVITKTSELSPPPNVVVTDQHTPLDDGFFKIFPKVKYVVSPTTGHTHLRFDPSKYGVELITLRGELEFLHGIKSVSEFTMRQVLALARPKTGIGSLLCGKTMGVVGLGRIGKQVSVLASSFGMNVKWVDKGSGDWAWKILFDMSDFVSIHLDENDSTKGIVNSELLGRMKPTSYLINTSRPSVLDEKALMNCLISKKIMGAALDVTDMDWSDVENCLVTPHIAGNTLEDRIRTDEFVIEKLKYRLGSRRVRVMELSLKS